MAFEKSSELTLWPSLPNKRGSPTMTARAVVKAALRRARRPVLQGQPPPRSPWAVRPRKIALESGEKPGPYPFKSAYPEGKPRAPRINEPPMNKSIMASESALASFRAFGRVPDGDPWWADAPLPRTTLRAVPQLFYSSLRTLFKALPRGRALDHSASNGRSSDRSGAPDLALNELLLQPPPVCGAVRRRNSPCWVVTRGAISDYAEAEKLRKHPGERQIIGAARRLSRHWKLIEPS